jgi:NADH-quinone oxidoreductase subunit G
MLKRFCRLQGWKDPGYFWSGDTLRKIKSATSRMDARLTVSLREVETADFILVIGADPLNEAPMLALAMRQAWRNGATVALVDPRPVSLPFPFHHLAVLPQNMELCATALIKGAVSRPEVEPLGAGALRFYDSIPDPYPFDSSLKDRFSELIPKLRKSRNAVVVCGTDNVEERIPGAAADNVLLLQSKERKVGLFHLMPGANAFGAALLSSEKSFMDTLEAIEGGMIKALVLVESDPFYIFPDRQRLEKALAKLDLLIVLDYLPSRSARFAHIFLPTSTLFETDSTFINQEGRVQFAAPVHLGGIPIEQLTGGDHPPRLFRGDIPGGEPRAAWQILGTLATAISPSAKEISREELWAWIAGENPVFSSIYPLDRHSDGVRLEPGGGNEKAYSIDPPERTEKQQRPEDGLQLLLADWTFGTEELSGYSRSVREAENPPFLSIHAKDAARLEIGKGDKVLIQLDGGSLEVEARVVEEMATGVIVLPRHHRLVWQRLKTLPAVVPFDRIKKMVTI